MPFEIIAEKAEGFDILHLADKSAGVSARVAPSLGWNLYQLHLPVEGRPTPILAEPASPAEMKATPSRFGHPILFPFPNRIRGGQYTWGGKSYTTPVNNGGNAIHGFALKSPWRVTRQAAGDDFAEVTARWQLSVDSPEHLPHWPADALLEVTYQLTRQGLKIKAAVTNPDTRPLPWGLGYHTYFHLPLGPDGSLAQTRIIIPASRRWHLDQFLPNGSKEPLPSSLDFRNGLPLQGLKADDVLTDLAHGADGQTTCQLQDLTNGWEIVVTTGRLFSEMVVFTPSWNPNAFAIEPYTQTTDAVNLAARGVDGGLKVLNPGETTEIEMMIGCRKIQ